MLCVNSRCHWNLNWITLKRKNARTFSVSLDKNRFVQAASCSCMCVHVQHGWVFRSISKLIENYGISFETETGETRNLIGILFWEKLILLRFIQFYICCCWLFSISFSLMRKKKRQLKKSYWNTDFAIIKIKLYFCSIWNSQEVTHYLKNA